MATWDEFAQAEPEMAALGLARLQQSGLAFLGTVRRDGSPRVNPVCPFIIDGRLYVATSPTSPKRLDLARDGRYVLHMLPGTKDEEFAVRGRARRIDDALEHGRLVERARMVLQPSGDALNIKDEEWIFEYDIEEADSAEWENFGRPDIRPIRQRWRESG